MKRPFAITVVSWLFIAVGVVATVVHTHTSLNSFHREDVLIVALELVAVVVGVFMLRGESWARWVAVTWMAFHVVVGYLNDRNRCWCTRSFFRALRFCSFAPMLGP